jgi:hypothetical protein
LENKYLRENNISLNEVNQNKEQSYNPYQEKQEVINESITKALTKTPNRVRDEINPSVQNVNNFSIENENKTTQLNQLPLQQQSTRKPNNFHYNYTSPQYLRNSNHNNMGAIMQHHYQNSNPRQKETFAHTVDSNNRNMIHLLRKY